MTLRPFANGSQFVDWEDRNCSVCSKLGDCSMSVALTVACFGDGTLSEASARGIGFLKSDGTTRSLEYVWDCPERSRSE